MESIIVALITGGLALVGVIVTNISSNNQIASKLVTAQAVTDTQIKSLEGKVTELTDEVRKHNSFADRITKLEVKVAELERKIE
jgi:uncharacterized protein involved in exopolysaccharide biosynthesis